MLCKKGSKIDNLCTQFGIKPAHTYLTHAYKTVDELKTLYPNQYFHVNESGKRVGNDLNGSQAENQAKYAKTIIKLYHPVYDLYAPDPEFNVEAFKTEMGLNKHVFYSLASSVNIKVYTWLLKHSQRS